MITGRKKYPSRERYEMSHPVVSAQVPKHVSDAIREMREKYGISLSRLLEDMVNGNKDYMNDLFEKGKTAGKRERGIWYYCSVCEKGIAIVPNTWAHRRIIELFRNHQWAHDACRHPSRQMEPKFIPFERRRP